MCSFFLVSLTAQRILHSLKSLGFFSILEWGKFFGNKSPSGYNCVCYLFRNSCNCFLITLTLFPSKQCGEYSFVSLETFIQVNLENFTWPFRLSCSCPHIYFIDGEHFSISGHELAICLQVTDVHLLTSVRLGHYTGCIILFHRSICEWTLQPRFLSVLSVGEVCSL